MKTYEALTECGIPITQREGTFGLEFEVEGTGLPSEIQGFRSTHDGSLRNGGLEYVFSSPRDLNSTKELINVLYSALSSCILDFNERTSTHVHVNVQDLSIAELWNFIFLSYISEDVLLEFCNVHRKRNLFCLPFSETHGIRFTLEQALNSKNLKDMFMRFHGNDQIRYASINLTSLTKYGSVEFRSLEGTEDKEKVFKWINALNELREMSKRFDNPYEIPQQFSEQGPTNFYYRFLEHLSPLHLNESRVDEKMRNNFWLCQDLIMNTNWQSVCPREKQPKSIKRRPLVRKGIVQEDDEEGEGQETEREEDSQITYAYSIEDFVNQPSTEIHISDYVSFFDGLAGQAVAEAVPEQEEARTQDILQRLQQRATEESIEEEEDSDQSYDEEEWKDRWEETFSDEIRTGAGVVESNLLEPCLREYVDEIGPLENTLTFMARVVLMSPRPSVQSDRVKRALRNILRELDNSGSMEYIRERLETEILLLRAQ